MAAKAGRRPSRVSAPSGADTDNGADLEILHPERTLTVAGRELTVREYGFIEGLRLRPLHAPLVAALAEGAHEKKVDDYEAVVDVLAQHADAVVALVAASCDAEPEWVADLRGADADMLLLAWWSVNRDFFMLAVTRRLAVRRLNASAGPTSTSPSQPPASAAETQPASEPSPSAS